MSDFVARATTSLLCYDWNEKPLDLHSQQRPHNTAESRYSDCRFSEEPRFSEVISAEDNLLRYRWVLGWASLNESR